MRESLSQGRRGRRVGNRIRRGLEVGHTHTHTHTHIPMVYKYSHVCTCTYTRTRTYTHAAHTHTHAHMHTRTLKHTNAYMQTYTLHAHTHTRTHRACKPGPRSSQCKTNEQVRLKGGIERGRVGPGGPGKHSFPVLCRVCNFQEAMRASNWRRSACMEADWS